MLMGLRARGALQSSMFAAGMGQGVSTQSESGRPWSSSSDGTFETVPATDIRTVPFYYKNNSYSRIFDGF